jgi:hypothetical protein
MAGQDLFRRSAKAALFQFVHGYESKMAAKEEGISNESLLSVIR